MVNVSSVALPIKLLLFFLILCPGVYLGDTLLNFCDIYIPTLFLYLVINKKITYRMNRTILCLCLYTGVALLSLVIASIDFGEIQWAALLKWLRLLYLPLIYFISTQLLDRGQLWGGLNTIGLLGGSTALFGLVLYMQQSEWYRAPQTMISLTGEIVYRAGGVFAEPGHFSFVLMISFIISNMMWSGSAKYCLLHIAVMFLSLWAIMLTYNRTAIIALVIFFLYRFCISLAASWLTRVKAFMVGVVLVVLSFSLYQINEDVEYLIDARVLPLIEISSQAEMSDLSAGRADTWENNLTHFSYQESEHWLFGRGYKIEDYNIGIYSIDNNFLSALLNTGVIGGVIFLLFWIFLLYDALGRYFDKRAPLAIVMGGCTVVLFLYCLTSDAVTMYRGMGVFMVLYAMNRVRVTGR